MSDLTQYNYGEAIVPPQTIICGVQLKPFCLGHVILLEQLKNPLLSEIPTDAELNDGLLNFFVALLICALDYENGIKLISNVDTFKDEMDMFCHNLQRNMKEDKDWNFLNKIALFKYYMKYYLDMPLYTESSSKGEEGTGSGTDWKNSIFIIFKKLGYTEKDILNMSLKKLFYEWTAFAESEGAISVMNKWDYEQIKRLKKGKK